jgi:hypothetical protein
MVAISLYEHNSVKTSFDFSFEYFKIRGDLADFAIMKSVPN